MKKLALLLALAMAFPLAASKNNHNAPNFEPVAVGAAHVAGRYVGFDSLYVIDLTASGGTLRKNQRTATLTNVVVDGSEVRATAQFAAGRSEPFRATFVIQEKDGQKTFGLLAHQVHLPVGENMMAQELFCPRR